MVKPPRVVVRVLACEVAFVVGLLIAGAGSVVVGATAVFLAVANNLLGPTLQALAKPRPRLSVEVVGATDANDLRVVVSALRPWPIAIDRIVRNEVDEARATASESSSTIQMLTTAMYSVTRPSEREIAESKTKHAVTVDAFEAELREWLREYAAAARLHSELYELEVGVSNAPNGAHAEAIELVLDLPESVTILDERPSMPRPPKRPMYSPPVRAQWAEDALHRAQMPIVRSVVDFLDNATPFMPKRDSCWQPIEGGRKQLWKVADVQPSRTVRAPDMLLVRAAGAGEHVITWHAYTKSDQEQAAGTITIIVPEDDANRPAFGRLHGITAYPDVPLVDDRDEEDSDEDDVFADDIVLDRVRNADPPVTPPGRRDERSRVLERSDDSSDVLAALDSASRYWEWQALGLDPAHDGVDTTIRVSRAKPVTNDERLKHDAAAASDGGEP